MPAVTGSIRFEDYTLFLIAAMVELRPLPPEGHPLAMLLGQMPPSIGVITNMNLEGAERVAELVSDNMEEFMDHITELMAPAQPIVGISVWQGDVEVLPDGELRFKGKYRRPTTADFGILGTIHQQLDDEARENALSHARQCRACAEKMGLDLGTVQEDGESHDDARHIFMRIPTIPGEH